MDLTPSLAPIQIKKSRELPDAIAKTRVVAIIRKQTTRDSLRICGALARGGVRAIEITMDSVDATRTIAAAVKQYSNEVIVGAGTVLSVRAAESAVQSGASYLVTPVVQTDVVNWSVQHEIPMLAGALTPTEASQAWESGATAVKLFPADSLSPTYLRAILAPLSHIPFVPTGGITGENALAWLEAGATALGVGSWLTGDGQTDEVVRRARSLIRATSLPKA